MEDEHENSEHEARRNERGAVSAEHALTMSIIAVAIVVAIDGLIVAIAGAFDAATSVLN